MCTREDNKNHIWETVVMLEFIHSILMVKEKYIKEQKNVTRKGRQT
jgi:hypothetical protein